MNLPAVAATLVAAALALASGEARAVACYLVYDRGDNVIYRDVYPPVDLSDAGLPEREAMRRRGEFMLFMETEQCPRLEFFTGIAGSVGLRLEETLAPSPAPAGEAKPAAAAPRRAAKPRPPG